MCENTTKTSQEEISQEIILKQKIQNLDQTIAMTVLFLEDFQL